METEYMTDQEAPCHHCRWELKNLTTTVRMVVFPSKERRPMMKSTAICDR